MTNEDLVMDVVRWLEKAAYNTDFELICQRIADRMQEELAPFVEFVIDIQYAGLEPTAVRYVARHPVTSFQPGVGLSDEEMQLLKEFVATTPDVNIRIWFETRENVGELLCLSQLIYIPKDQRNAFIEKLKVLMKSVIHIGGNLKIDDDTYEISHDGDPGKMRQKPLK